MDEYHAKPFTVESDLPVAGENNLSQGNYEQVIEQYQKLLEVEPENNSLYWQLGLAYLLQGNEAEAQVTWMMGMLEAEPEQIDQLNQELAEVLQAAAEQQESLENIQTAWLIRQHLQQIAPSAVENVLGLVRLSLHLDCFTPEKLLDWNIIALLNSNAFVDTETLLNLFQKTLNQAPEHPQVFAFTEACLPFFTSNPAPFVDILLPKIKELYLWLNNYPLACRYAELCVRVDPNNTNALFMLAVLYQDQCQYEKGIECAQRYDELSESPLQKVIANALVLRSYMISGADWSTAVNLLERQTSLLNNFSATPRLDANRFVPVSVVGIPLFFYPYFKDHPTETRSLWNQTTALFQNSFQAYIHQHSDYRAYPLSTFTRTNKDRSKIRVAYLSRFLRRHSVGWLCRWFFKYYNRDRFEVYTYFNQLTRFDSFTQHWFINQSTRACMFQGDSLGVAEAIREDEIDILVDLDSITFDTNCGVVALKPAPVQVTWLGLDASGLPAIDYFIGDPYVLPDNAEEYYSEKIWRLPQTYIAVDGFEVGVPILQRAQLNIPSDATVYLSAQTAYKRHPDTIRLQMQILKEVPNSYFLIKGRGDEVSIRERFEQVAEEVGVACDRLRFLPRDPDEEIHRANLGIADVVLDTFPYNGATTTLETLWMGIPIVTKVGQQFAARNSYTMMINAGITEGIAWTDEEYIEWGIRLGTDASLRQQISWKLRQSRQTAPLWNAQQFTREMERAFEQMWDIYLQS